jgi:hypothetical protein
VYPDYFDNVTLSPGEFKSFAQAPGGPQTSASVSTELDEVSAEPSTARNADCGPRRACRRRFYANVTSSSYESLSTNLCLAQRVTSHQLVEDLLGLTYQIIDLDILQPFAKCLILGQCFTFLFKDGG